VIVRARARKSTSVNVGWHALRNEGRGGLAQATPFARGSGNCQPALNERSRWTSWEPRDDRKVHSTGRVGGAGSVSPAAGQDGGTPAIDGGRRPSLARAARAAEHRRRPTRRPLLLASPGRNLEVQRPGQRHRRAGQAPRRIRDAPRRPRSPTSPWSSSGRPGRDRRKGTIERPSGGGSMRAHQPCPFTQHRNRRGIGACSCC
jgi:hypothetical protein